jgi:HAD superfamily hydrolase (TIGR01662 family)
VERLTTTGDQASGAPAFDLVVPTIGRPGLATLLVTLDESGGVRPNAIVIADDRRNPSSPLGLPDLAHLSPRVVAVGGRGPAAARNAGWRRCSSPWVVFLDDDVVPAAGWLDDLAADLLGCTVDVAAVQGRVTVPLPVDRPPTDYERNVAGLQSAVWITADLAVRRQALVAVGGFDERFPRAYREDTDLALRLMDRGWRLTRGVRRVSHPVGPSTWRTSIRAQRGNADDALMRRLHGPSWRELGSAPRGAIGGHVVTSTLALVAAAAAVTRRPRLRRIATALATVRLGSFWLRRVVPGPRRVGEWLRLLPSSMAIPFVAPVWRAWGTVRARTLAPDGRADRWNVRPPAMVLFDRDGTLVHDVAYNGEPARVAPVEGAAEALGRLRAAGIAVGMITNQSGIGRGWLTPAQVDSVNERVAELLGPFAITAVCPHTEADSCACRKPAPGMVLAAATAAGVPVERCAVVGDIGSDVGAALAAGARGVLVPNGATLSDEIAAAPELAENLNRAVDILLEAPRWSA